MLGRQPIAKIANVAFLVFFALFTAGSIIWLLSGIPPILAGRIPAVHQTLHRWGAGDQGFVVISRSGLGQRVTADSRWVPARELAVRAGAPVVVWFKNDDHRISHNFVIYQHNEVTRVFRSQTTIGPSQTRIAFTAPPPGHYVFRDELHTSRSAEFVSVDPAHNVPAWARWVPGLRTAADHLCLAEQDAAARLDLATVGARLGERLGDGEAESPVVRHAGDEGALAAQEAHENPLTRIPGE